MSNTRLINGSVGGGGASNFPSLEHSSSLPDDGQRHRKERQEKQAMSIGKVKMENANHLLNFSLPERPPVEHYTPKKRARNYTRQTKEQFVQANFRFVLREGRDYTALMFEPDFRVKWADVEQVLVCHETQYECPICLYPPTVAKVTCCGHVFCWCCIVQYMDGALWKKCPICQESVGLTDLKSTLVQEEHQWKPGQRVKFNLMARSKECTTVHTFAKRSKKACLLDISHPDSKFQRFATITDVGEILEREELLLKEAVSEAQSLGEDSSVGAIYTALGLLKERRIDWAASKEAKVLYEKRKAEITSSLSDSRSQQSYNVWEETAGDSMIERDQEIENEEEKVTKKEEEEEEAVVCLKEEKEEKSEKQRSQKERESTVDCEDQWFFYQVETGQLIFLHPLNYQCLLSEFGQVSNFPRQFSASILQIEEVSQTQILRKRMKFLNHLPLSTTFYFCEVDLSKIVSYRAIKPIKEKLNKRAREREKKRSEKRREVNKEEKQRKARQGRVEKTAKGFPPLSQEEKDLQLALKLSREEEEREKKGKGRGGGRQAKVPHLDDKEELPEEGEEASPLSTIAQQHDEKSNSNNNLSPSPPPPSFAAALRSDTIRVPPPNKKAKQRQKKKVVLMANTPKRGGRP